MLLIGFDTCLDKMYVTLKRNGNILSSEVVENTDTKYHSAFLISTLQEIMSKNDVKPQDLDLITVNIGPGSFTGIRACTTVSRVMAQQLDIKAIGVSSLEILAKLNNTDKKTLVALDARKNSAYLLLDGEIKGAVLLEEIQEIIKNGDYYVITDNKLKPILGGISYQEGKYPLGEILVEIAEKKSQTEECNWRKLKPLYIQPPPMGT